MQKRRVLRDAEHRAFQRCRLQIFVVLTDDKLDDDGYPTPRPHSEGIETLAAATTATAKIPRTSRSTPKPANFKVRAKYASDESPELAPNAPLSSTEARSFVRSFDRLHKVQAAAINAPPSRETDDDDVNDYISRAHAEYLARATRKPAANAKERIADPILRLHDYKLADDTTPTDRSFDLSRRRRSGSSSSDDAGHVANERKASGGVAYNFEFEPAHATKPTTISGRPKRSLTSNEQSKQANAFLDLLANRKTPMRPADVTPAAAASSDSNEKSEETQPERTPIAAAAFAVPLQKTVRERPTSVVASNVKPNFVNPRLAIDPPASTK